jgi:hypothetical protein
VIVAAASRDTEPRQNIGKRVVVTDHTSGKFSVYVDSLGGPLALDGGGKDVKDIRYRPANLRRVWQGVTTAERRALARLRLGCPMTDNITRTGSLRNGIRFDFSYRRGAPLGRQAGLA